MIDKPFLVDTLAKLVQINSINPCLDNDGPGEEEIGMFIQDLLESLAIKATIQRLGDKRVNVIGTLRGSGNRKGKSLMFNAHMDTVGVKDMEKPFSAMIKDDKLYGRGAYDMKGSIAAILAMAKALKDYEIELNGDVILTFVADEEFESEGTLQIVQSYTADACIVAEPTNLDICIAHRGFGVYKITTYGQTAHGGNHREGIDANLRMGLVLAELQKISEKLIQENKHPMLGEASLHVPLISGGNSLFVYSNECEIRVERRTLPGEKESDVLEELETIIEKITAKHQNFKASIEPLIWRDPYEIATEAPIVNTLQQCAEKILKRKPGYIGHSWWEDSGLLGKAGIATAIIGPSGGGIHEDVEWVDLSSVEALSNIFLKTAIHYCR